MSTFDLTSDYFQLCLREDDIPKIAFVTKQGLVAFNRIAFGLNGAPASFQKAMDCILKPMLGKNDVAYLDVIITTNGSFEEHIQSLTKAFTLLKEAGLTVNIAKCKLAIQEIPFLGCTITQDGLKADDSKVRQ